MPRAIHIWGRYEFPSASTTSPGGLGQGVEEDFLVGAFLPLPQKERESKEMLAWRLRSWLGKNSSLITSVAAAERAQKGPPALQQGLPPAMFKEVAANLAKIELGGLLQRKWEQEKPLPII